MRRAKAVAKAVAAKQQQRECFKFQYELTVHTLSGIDQSQGPAGSVELVVQIMRGSKLVQTKAAAAAGGSVSWEEQKTMVCTLHSSKKADVLFSEKVFAVKIWRLVKGVPKLEVATGEVNLAGFASVEAQDKTTSHTLLMAPHRGQKTLDATVPANLALTIKSTYLKDLEVDDDEQSMSSNMPALNLAAGGTAGAERVPSMSSEQDLRGFDEPGASAGVPPAEPAAAGGSAGAAAGAGAGAADTGEESPPHAAGAAPAAAEAAMRRDALVSELQGIKEQIEGDIQRQKGDGGLAPLRRAGSLEVIESAVSAATDRSRLQLELEALRAELQAAHTRCAEAEVAREAAVADLTRVQQLTTQGTLRLERKLADTEQAMFDKGAEAALAMQRTVEQKSVLTFELEQAGREFTELAAETTKIAEALEAEAAAAQALRDELQQAEAAHGETRAELDEKHAKLLETSAELAEVTRELSELRSAQAAASAAASAAAATAAAAGAAGEEAVEAARAEATALRAELASARAAEEAALAREAAAKEAAAAATAEADKCRVAADTHANVAMEAEVARVAAAEKAAAAASAAAAAAAEKAVSDEHEAALQRAEAAGRAAAAAEAEKAAEAREKAAEAALTAKLDEQREALEAEVAQEVAEMRAAVEAAEADFDTTAAELEAVREQLVQAKADAEAARSELRGEREAAAKHEEAVVAPLKRALSTAATSDGGGGAAAAADAAEEAAEEAAEAAEAAEARELELSELQLALVEAKIRLAELEYEKEEYRGRARVLGRQLDALGGGSLQVAQHSTQLEVQLAASRSEAAKLRAENEALNEDLGAMIELKLQLAEALATNSPGSPRNSTS